MKLSLYDVIVRPSITEKYTRMQEPDGKYTFEVHITANKHQIREAVEKIFNVHVVKVNTSRHKGKMRRIRREPGMTAKTKKAVVTLKKGEKIDVAV